ncbi:MAG: hypothetical protein ABII39_07165 [Candidatus Micrarchaeota archaeon]
MMQHESVAGEYSCTIQDMHSNERLMAERENAIIINSREEQIAEQENITITESGITFEHAKINGTLGWNYIAGNRAYHDEMLSGNIIPNGDSLRIDGDDERLGYGFVYDCVKNSDTEISDNEPRGPSIEEMNKTLKEMRNKQRKGVFIRPCEGQFYISIGSRNENTLVVDGNPEECTGSRRCHIRKIADACRDLLNSGVTDIFVGFRVDDEDKCEGRAGDRLSSSEQNNPNTTFDPVGAIINTCRVVYKRGRKTLKVHAWVPIFQDREAAKIEGQKGYIGKEGLTEQIWGWLFGKGEPQCESTLFAEPTNEEVVQYELKVLDEITRRYGSKLYGINLDYIRYTDSGVYECVEFGEKNQNVYEWIVDPNAPANFVKRVVERYPGFVISGNVMPQEVYRIKLGQENTLQYLEMIMPMTYTRFGAGAWTSITAEVGVLQMNHLGVPIMADLRAWPIPNTTDQNVNAISLFPDLSADIRASLWADGFVLFTYESLLDSTGSKSLYLIMNRIDF